MNEIKEQTFANHLQEELAKIERGFWVHGNDPDYYRNNMVDSGLAVLEPGVMSRSQAIDMTSISKPWADVEMSDLRVMTLCADCVALIYTADGHRPDNQEAYRARVVSTYLRRDGRWQLALHQQTMISPKALPK